MWHVTLFLSLAIVLSLIGVAFCPNDSKTCSGKCDNCLLEGKCDNSSKGKGQWSVGCEIKKTDDSVVKERITNLYGKLPLTFVENKGQYDEKVRFCTRSPKATIYFCSNEAVFHFIEKKEIENPKPLEKPEPDGGKPEIEEKHKELVLRVSFPDSNPNVIIEGQDDLPGKVNVFRGSDQSKWLTNIPTYKKVIYHNLWDGIDLVYYGMPEYGMKYDLVIRPGADPSKAKFQYAGHDDILVNPSGEFVVQTAIGQVTEKKPYIYQEIKGNRIEIEASFVIEGNNLSWRIRDYDRGYALIIDPGLIYSTFLGGTLLDHCEGIAVDTLGNAYITGQTKSLGFPTRAGAYDTTYNGNSDIFITKLNSAGNGLIYSTFLGATLNDTGWGIAIDTLGNAYITGLTYSSDFPTTPGAYDTSFNGGKDAFITKLNSAGNGLIYSTFLGGTLDDDGRGIAIDTLGNACITGLTYSSNFPTTPGAYDTVS